MQAGLEPRDCWARSEAPDGAAVVGCGTKNLGSPRREVREYPDTLVVLRSGRATFRTTPEGEVEHTSLCTRERLVGCPSEGGSASFFGLITQLGTTKNRLRPLFWIGLYCLGGGVGKHLCMVVTTLAV